jgi:hypothetical protein
MKGQIIHKHLYSSGLKVGAQASRYAHVKNEDRVQCIVDAILQQTTSLIYILAARETPFRDSIPSSYLHVWQTLLPNPTPCSRFR